MNCKKPTPLFTLGNLPTSYLLSMTYEEQLIWFGNYISETILPALNKIQESVDKLDIDTILQTIEDMKTYISQMETNLQNEFQELDVSLTNKVNNDILTGFNQIRSYLDIELVKINDKIDNISIDNIIMRNPTTGLLDNIENIINDIFYQSVNGITANAFDSKELTATEFDSKNISAYEFDTQSASLL